MAARDCDSVVCDGEWDISRRDELASRMAQALSDGIVRYRAVSAATVGVAR